MNSSRRNARGEETLRTILGETVKLVSRNGFDGTTISQITQAAGKPASSIYWLFSTKDELIAAALETTYQRGIKGIGLWPNFDPLRSVGEQLTENLGPSFVSRSPEDPVRLGLLVALEGSSDGSAARIPFAKRRQKVRTGLSVWWQTAANAQQASKVPEIIGENMAALTIALLDGHYMSDAGVSENLLAQRRRGEYVAAALAGAFALMVESAGNLRIVMPNDAARNSGAQSVEHGEPQELLTATRALVAERGYNGATLTRICQRSGMQRSSVYWRYKDKDKLISAAVSEPFLKLADMVSTQDAFEADAISHLALSGAESIKAAMEDRSSAIAGLQLKLQRRTPLVLASSAILEGLEKHHAQLSVELEQHFSDYDGLPAEVVRWLLHTLWEGLLLGVSFDVVYEIEGLAKVLEVMLAGAAEQALQESKSRKM